MKQFFSILILLVLGCVIVLLNPGKLGQVIFCDVGQGDAVLVQMGHHQVLYDAGADSQVLNCLARYMPLGDSVVELFVASHADKDHIGGFTAVAQKYSFQHILISPTTKDSDVFRNVEDYIQSTVQDTQIVVADQGIRLCIGGISLDILGPDFSETEKNIFRQHITESVLSATEGQNIELRQSENSLSINLNVTLYGFTIVLTGDSETTQELALTTNGLLIPSKVLKAGHHGSKTSNSDELLVTTRPEYIVVSAGENNTFGHPSGEVMEQFRKTSAKIFQTAQVGHVVFDIVQNNMFKKPIFLATEM